MRWEPYRALDQRQCVQLVDEHGPVPLVLGSYEVGHERRRFRVHGARKWLENEHDARAAVAMSALLRAENTANRLRDLLDAEVKAASVPRETIGRARRSDREEWRKDIAAIPPFDSTSDVEDSGAALSFPEVNEAGATSLRERRGTYRMR